MEENVKTLLNNMLLAIECEREEERTRHIEEIKRLSPYQREQKGRALVNLRVKKLGRTLTGDLLYLFRKKSKEKFPSLEISVGDELVISQYDPLDVTNPTGIVYEIASDSIVISTPITIEKAGVRPFRLDLFVSDLTYARMTEALTRLKTDKNSYIRQILSGSYYPVSSLVDIEAKELNEVQKLAASYAMSANGFYTVQGPPGTGKTFMAAVLIKNLINSGKKVLISADSNAAVDNLMRKCLDIGLLPLRIGHPIRVNDDLKQYTLDYSVIRHERFQEVKLIESDIEALKERLKEKEKPTQDKLRGHSYAEILELISSGHSSRGLSRRTLHSMKPYVKLRVKIDNLYEKIKEVKDDVVRELISQSPIIAATNSTAGSQLLSYTNFDFAVVDEASQASMPSTIIPIQKADRFVLVGDHYQLPPVVISEKARNLGLDISLMDRLVSLYPYQMMRLKKQYRMNDKIMNLVSSVFYEDSLLADEEVLNRRLLVEDSDEVISIIDVKGVERINADSKSYYNEAEIKTVKTVLDEYISLGVSVKDIGVITPYRAQVKALRELNTEVEIDTVDAFQGREKDMIIISFVRSNERDSIGFLSDIRRLNVAISRARKKLILIGNIDLLRKHEIFSRVFEGIEDDTR